MLLQSTVSILGCNATVAVSYSGALHDRVVSTGTSWLLPLLAMDSNLPKMHMGNSLSKNLQALSVFMLESLEPTCNISMYFYQF